MQTWSFVDKSQWNDGVWKEEPDKAQWIDEKTGLDCLIVRGPAGALCGYVGVPESHQLFGLYCGDFNLSQDPHGGLTFGAMCSPEEKETGVCHTGNVANEKVWWFGFDCAHSGDLCPGYPKYLISFKGDLYRNLEYVKSEVTKLASALLDPVTIDEVVFEA